jgi:phosphatidylglycerophosphate synthase
MQGVIVIPEMRLLRPPEGGKELLTREIAGVPLLLRVIATAKRAGMNSLLVIWPDSLDGTLWDTCSSSPLLRGIEITKLITSCPFDPRKSSSWVSVAGSLKSQWLWLPWNWVTDKRALTEVILSVGLPPAWDVPALITKRAAIDKANVRIVSDQKPEGVSIDSRRSVRKAEQLLVARSGKPSDGIYSRFNRLLCRPVVRWLTHTRATPNHVTIGGLAVAIVAALMYARGIYAACVAGALLFFLSGLFDEADGMLARIGFRESAWGTWFEGFVDNATYLLVFTGITIGLYRQRGRRELVYGLALIAGCALSILIIALQRRISTAPDLPHEYAGRLNQLLESDSANPISRAVRQIHIFIKKGVAVHYVLIFTVVGALPLFLRLAALGANATWILALYFNHRFFRRHHSRSAIEEVKTAA